MKNTRVLAGVSVFLATAVVWELAPAIKASGIAPLAYNLVQQAGVALTRRGTINCSTGMNCSDDAVNGVTTFTATGTGGSVTSFSSGNLSPLFTTNVTNPTTTPALAFTLSNAASGAIFSNFSGGSAAPQFNPVPICPTGVASSLTGFTCITPGPTTNQNLRTFGVGFDGGGSAVVVNTVRYMTMPIAGTIGAWNFNVDTGTASVDVWKIGTGTANPTIANSILSGGFLSISTGTALHSTDLTKFTTTTVTANDIIGVQAEAVSGATTINFEIVIAAN